MSFPADRERKAHVAAVEQCQLLFLRAAVNHPQIRLEASLREQVLARWPLSWADNRRDGAVVLPPECETLIINWAALNNLNYSWVVYHARRAILLWLLSPNAKPFEYELEVSSPPIHPPLRLPREPVQAFLRRQMGQIEKELRDHSAMLSKERAKVMPDRGSRDSHYRWAAERICLRWSYAKIARENSDHVSDPAVRKAVLRVLEKLG